MTLFIIIYFFLMWEVSVSELLSRQITGKDESLGILSKLFSQMDVRPRMLKPAR